MSNNHKCTVWIVNDGGHNYEPASKFGELSRLTEGNLNPLLVDRIAQDLGRTIGALVQPDDYLLLSGYVIINVLAVTFWLKLYGECKMLQWNAKTRDYEMAVLNSEHLGKLLEKGILV